MPFNNSNTDVVKWEESGKCHRDLAEGNEAIVLEPRFVLAFWSQIDFCTVLRELYNLMDITEFLV
jgi:hypothetical protein